MKKFLQLEELLKIKPLSEFEVKCKNLSQALKDLKEDLINARLENKQEVIFVPSNPVNLVVLAYILKDSGYYVHVEEDEFIVVSIRPRLKEVKVVQ